MTPTLSPAPTNRPFPAWLLLLLASLLCISAGLYNGFPLVTSDTGAYLNSAMNLQVPNSRPIIYPLFARFTGWKFSHWLIMWAQGLLLGAVLLACLRTFAPRLGGGLRRLALLGVLAWTTGFSWYCSQLMPDIFTAVGLLTLALLVLGPPRRPAGQAALLALLLLSTMMHNSNLLTFSLTTLGFGVVAWRQRLFTRGLLRRAQWLAATATVLASWVLLPAIHAAFGAGFTVSQATPAFLVARFLEAGILDKYLQRNCDVANPSPLCAYRDNLPNDAVAFLWDANSPYNKSGGLDTNEAGYRLIVRDIVTSPRYYPYLATMAVQGTLRQLTHINHGDGLVNAFRENTNPYWKVGEYANYELKNYMSSLQNTSSLDFKDLNQRANLVQLLALLLAVGVVARRYRPAPASARAAPPEGPFATLLLLLALWGLGLLFNAFATGALANVIDRLQGRVAWLLPLWALLLLVQCGPAWWRSARVQGLLHPAPPAA